MSQRRSGKAKRASSANLMQQKTTVGNMILGIVLTVVIVGAVGYGVYKWNPLGVFAGAPIVEEEEEDQKFTFLGMDYYTLEEVETDETEIDIYGKDTSKLTDEQIEELTIADFTLKASKETGDSFTPDDSYFEGDFLYYVNVTGADYCTLAFIPQLGLNTFYLMNETEDVAIAMISKDEYSTSFNHTAYDEWNVMYTCLDGLEGVAGTEPALGEGFLPFGDFTEDSDFETGPSINNFVVIKIVANTTWEGAWCDLDLPVDTTFSEHIVGTALFYEIEDPILGSGEFTIDFGSTLGTDFEVVNCSIGYGSHDSFTAWDTYTA